MNAILGYAQLMERQPELKGRLRDYTAVIARSGDHLLALINDVLEMSKIEAGSVTLSPQDFNIRALLKDADSMFRIRALEKGLDLKFMVDGVPECLRADVTKVRQVLVNIIGNAIKFTDSGDVEVLASAREMDARNLLVRISIVDTGPGIPESEQAKVFEAFEQTESGHRKGGTGLGMSISRQYARMMGGDLTIESTPGIGTTVRFTFKASPAERSMEEARYSDARQVTGLAPDSLHPRILIVDDIESNRDILKLMLAGVGISDIREAENGSDALDIVKDWRPHIVLMDRRMPGMDGMTITRKIRETREGNDIRILMVTASAFEEDRQLAFDAGVDGFVGKPFREPEILSEIRRLCPQVSYRYEDERSLSPEVENDDGEENPTGLDKKLTAKLIGLIESGDVLRFEKCIAEQLRFRKPDMYDRLHELVQRFDYAHILAILKPEEEK
jgi:CheY-like chemotaxis protein/anti-sigma regulatory factor (Ser/Thr protein kinase)